jgi:DNA polymerase III epsilon subunit-like protein
MELNKIENDTDKIGNKTKFSLKCIKNHFDEIKYNEEQLKFINAPLENASLLGTPGCGKSSTIIGKIIHLFLNKTFIKTNEYKLFTFSKRACCDFIEKGRKIHSRIFHKNSINTLHSVAGKVLYHVTKKKSSSKNSVIMSALYLFENNIPDIAELLKAYDGLNNCKVIFVDEAQDISDIQYKLIMKMADFYNIPVIMIGDPNQNIYQFQNGSDKYLLEHSSNKYYLIKNYRSTPQIVNLINSIRPWDNLTPKMVSMRSQENTQTQIQTQIHIKPHIIVDSITNITKNIVDKIRHLSQTLNIGLEEMAIIGPVKKSKPNGDKYANIGLSLFTNLLCDEKIDYIKHYEDTNGEGGGGDIDRDIEYKKNHINLFTIHGSKGLEFKVVFLLNYHLNTFGIMPSEEDYNRFKYLWYVGLSRAADYLYIYIDENKFGFYDLKNVKLDDIIYEKKFPKLMPKLEFKEEVKPVIFSVTEILRNKKYMNDRLYHYFIEAFGEKEIIKEQMWNNDTLGLTDFYELDKMDFYKIYGIFMEHIFNFYYNMMNNNIADFVIKNEKIIKNTVELPKKYSKAYNILKMRNPEIAKECITLSVINNYKNILTPSEIELYAYLALVLNNDFSKEFFLQIENNVISYPRNRLLDKITFIHNYLHAFMNNDDFGKNGTIKDEIEEIKYANMLLYIAIFELAIFTYQYDNEAAYLWKENISSHVLKLYNHIKHVGEFAMKTYKTNVSEGDEYIYKFHKKYIHNNLPIIGEVDMINKSAIVDLKFSHSSMEKYIDQICMYYMLYDNKMESDINLELWNILKGEKLIIKLDKTAIQRVILLQVLCKAINHKLKNMAFIYDLETTGLYYTNNNVDIIERHVEEYGTHSIWSYGLVIPQNLPFIPFEVTKITGITKEMVYAEGESINVMIAEFENIFRYCEMPTFIAHNGSSFDHKILFDKKMLKENECKVLDSRYLLRLLINDSKICEKSLGEIYDYYYPNNKIVKHRASNDVEMLIKIFEILELYDISSIC